MPSQAMQEAIGALRDRRKAAAGQAPPTLDERRATFTPRDRLHPVPDDVLASDVTAGGVPAHWLTAPGADPGRVLMFLHGGGFEFGSVRSDGELAARLGRASGMRVLFPEYRLAPEHHFPAAIDDVLAAWRWLRTDQGLSASSIAVAGDSAGGGTSSCSAPPRRPRPPSESGSSCGPRFGSRVGSPFAVRDRLGQLRPPLRRREGVGEVLRLVRDQLAGERHDTHRVGGRAVIGDHALADPKVAATPDPQDPEVALGRVPAALRLDLRPAPEALAGLRIVQYRVGRVDRVLRVAVSAFRRRPVLLYPGASPDVTIHVLFT
jgi:hypothetical protein